MKRTRDIDKEKWKGRERNRAERGGDKKEREGYLINNGNRLENEERKKGEVERETREGKRVREKLIEIVNTM